MRRRMRTRRTGTGCRYLPDHYFQTTTTSRIRLSLPTLPQVVFQNMLALRDAHLQVPTRTLLEFGLTYRAQAGCYVGKGYAGELAASGAGLVGRGRPGGGGSRSGGLGGGGGGGSGLASSAPPAPAPPRPASSPSARLVTFVESIQTVTSRAAASTRCAPPVTTTVD